MAHIGPIVGPNLAHIGPIVGPNWPHYPPSLRPVGAAAAAAASGSCFTCGPGHTYSILIVALASVKLAMAAQAGPQARDWENPAVVGISKRRAHVPLRSFTAPGQAFDHYRLSTGGGTRRTQRDWRHARQPPQAAPGPPGVMAGGSMPNDACDGAAEAGNPT